MSCKASDPVQLQKIADVGPANERSLTAFHMGFTLVHLLVLK